MLVRSYRSRLAMQRIRINPGGRPPAINSHAAYLRSCSWIALTSATCRLCAYSVVVVSLAMCVVLDERFITSLLSERLNLGSWDPRCHPSRPLTCRAGGTISGRATGVDLQVARHADFQSKNMIGLDEQRSPRHGSLPRPISVPGYWATRTQTLCWTPKRRSALSRSPVPDGSRHPST